MFHIIVKCATCWVFVVMYDHGIVQRRGTRTGKMATLCRISLFTFITQVTQVLSVYLESYGLVALPNKIYHVFLVKMENIDTRNKYDVVPGQQTSLRSR